MDLVIIIRMNLENVCKNDLQVSLEGVTWIKDSHSLFDHESRDLVKSNLIISSSGKLYRSLNCIRLTTEEPAKDSEEFIAKITKTSTVISILSGDLPIWRAIHYKYNGYYRNWHALEKGQFIKLGRVKYRVKELCSKQEDSESASIDREVQLSYKECEGNLCRLCFSGVDDVDNPLISPCNCGGTMKYVHLQCFKKWIALHTHIKASENWIRYSLNSLTCEISRCVLSSKLFLKDKGAELIETVRREPPYILLEYCNKAKNEYNLNLIMFKNKKTVNLGRGHDNEIRICDLSISRHHAGITLDGNQFIISDNQSKFGTLIKEKAIYLSLQEPKCLVQIGRSLIGFQVADKP